MVLLISFLAYHHNFDNSPSDPFLSQYPTLFFIIPMIYER